MSNGRKLANLLEGTEIKVTNVDSDLANTISSIKSRLDSDDAKLQALDTAIAAGVVNLADSDLIISQLEAKISSAVSNVDSDSLAIQAANTQIEIIKARLDSDSIKLQSISIGVAAEIAATNNHITDIKSRLDSDDTKLQSLDTTISGLVSRLDSDEIAIQAVSSLVNSAITNAGMTDSDLKVVADLRSQLDSEIIAVRNLNLSYTNYNYNATAGQTSFSGTDANSLTLAYIPNAIQVFLNGILLEAADYTATNGTSIVLTEAAQASAQLTILVAKAKSTYIMIVNWSTLTKQQKLLPTGLVQSDYFGLKVDMSGDYIIAGAHGYDPSGLADTGAAYIFLRSGSSWSQQALLLQYAYPAYSANYDMLGQSVLLNEDATEAFVYKNGLFAGKSTAPAICTFTRTGTTWTEGQTIYQPTIGWGWSGNLGVVGTDPKWGRGGNVTQKGSYFAVGANDDQGNSSSASTRYGSAWVYYKDPLGYQVKDMSFVDGTLVSGQSSTHTSGVAFNLNGTQMFVLNQVGSKVLQFNLSTAYDASTASYSSNYYAYSESGAASGLRFNADGTRMFISGSTYSTTNQLSLFQYNLSIGFDLSTASLSISKDLRTATHDIRGFDFNDVGTKLFFTNGGASNTNQGIHEYHLTTAYDLSTMGSLQASFNIVTATPAATSPYGITFNSKGTKMFVLNRANRNIYIYDLSTGYDITTAAYNGEWFGSMLNAPGGGSDKLGTMTFSPTGHKLFITCDRNHFIREWDTTDKWVLQQELISSDDALAENKDFGQDLVMSTDSVLAVSSPYVNNRTGAVYVFTRSGTTWTESAKIVGLAQDTTFGAAIAMDGDYMAISAPIVNTNTGVVYIYKNIGGTWTSQTSLTASNASTGSYFGSGLQLRDDLLLVGTSIGACYVFARSGSTWSEDKIINTSDTDSYATNLGGSVSGMSINNDATKDDLVLGASGHGAYVFTV